MTDIKEEQILSSNTNQRNSNEDSSIAEDNLPCVRTWINLIGWLAGIFKTPTGWFLETQSLCKCEWRMAICCQLCWQYMVDSIHFNNALWFSQCLKLQEYCAHSIRNWFRPDLTAGKLSSTGLFVMRTLLLCPGNTTWSVSSFIFIYSFLPSTLAV